MVTAAIYPYMDPRVYSTFNPNPYPQYNLQMPYNQMMHPSYPVMSYRSQRPGGKPDPSIKAALANREVWQEFNKIGTEMIITKNGRRMFPTINMSVIGLDSNKKYFIFLDVPLADENRYKFQGKEWVVGGKAEQQPAGRLYVHPESPATGSSWMSQTITFHKLKLTNNNLDGQGHIIISSMHKYLPRVHIVEGSTLAETTFSHWNTFSFSKTKFISVTAYQNENITKLKISHNPFAKGFRENGQSRNKKRAKLSPSPSLKSCDNEEEHIYNEKRPRLHIVCNTVIDDQEVENRSSSPASSTSDEIIDVENMSDCDYSSSTHTDSPQSLSSQSISPSLPTHCALGSQSTAQENGEYSLQYPFLPMQPLTTDVTREPGINTHKIIKPKLITAESYYSQLPNNVPYFPSPDPRTVAMYYSNMLLNSSPQLKNSYAPADSANTHKFDLLANRIADSSSILRGGLSCSSSAFSCHIPRHYL